MMAQSSDPRREIALKQFLGFGTSPQMLIDRQPVLGEVHGRLFTALMEPTRTVDAMPTSLGELYMQLQPNLINLPRSACGEEDLTQQCQLGILERVAGPPHYAYMSAPLCSENEIVCGPSMLPCRLPPDHLADKISLSDEFSQSNSSTAASDYGMIAQNVDKVRHGTSSNDDPPSVAHILSGANATPGDAPSPEWLPHNVPPGWHSGGVDFTSQQQHAFPTTNAHFPAHSSCSNWAFSSQQPPSGSTSTLTGYPASPLVSQPGSLLGMVPPSMPGSLVAKSLDFLPSSQHPSAFRRGLHVTAPTHDAPYAQLLYSAFLCHPRHAMTLQEIYEWFRENTKKGEDGKKGWQNSIRHNLSMNGVSRKHGAVWVHSVN
jgi:hypothetical protein